MLTLSFVRPAALLRAASFAAAIAAAGTAAHAQSPDPLLAKVNGVEIHQSDLAIAEEEAGQLPPMSADAKRDYLVSFVSDMILLAKAAEQQKIGDTPDFKKKMEFARDKLLMTTLFESTGKAALTDEAMHKVYDEAVKQIPDEEEAHARHILIRATAGDDKASKAAEDKIKAIIARLNKGEDFAKLATELTEDPSGKANGGDLGFFTKAQMVPEFSTTAFALEPGKISQPVKTQFGWHVIKLEEKRKKAPPSFDEVRTQIETYVVRKAQAEYVTKLRETATIEKFYKSEEPKKDEPAEPAKK